MAENTRKFKLIDEFYFNYYFAIILKKFIIIITAAENWQFYREFKVTFYIINVMKFLNFYFDFQVLILLLD